MIKYIVYVATVFALVHCKCEGTFTTATKIENLSTVDVSIKMYRGGVLAMNAILVKSGSTVQIGESHGRTKAILLNSELLAADSVIVEFGSIRKSVHTNNGRNTPTAIAYSSSRNVLNNSNYTQKILVEDKCFLQTNLTYTFTTMDYQNAK
jgi:hypothetical protein